DFWRDHLRAIELNYRKAPYFNDYFEELSSRLIRDAETKLVDLNVHLIEWLMDILGIHTQLRFASELNQQGKRTELLANICISIGAKQYISPPGSATYLLREKEMLLNENIGLFFQHYEHPQYKQSFPPFCPQASVLDLIFNEGPKSLEVIRKGRRQPLLVSELALQQRTV